MLQNISDFFVIKFIALSLLRKEIFIGYHVI